MRPPGRNWHEAFLLLLTIVFAAMAWLSGSEKQVIAASFPAWSQYLWYGGLVFGSMIALVGIAWHTVTGLLVERAALLILSGLCGAYGAAFLAYAYRSNLFHAVFVVFFVGVFAAVNLVRARQVRVEVEQIRSGLRELALRAQEST